MKIIKDEFEKGQELFFDIIKQSLFDFDENIFEKIDFYNDNIYSNPLLFLFFTNEKNQISLYQILFNYFSSTYITFKVKSNINGFIYLSNYGNLKTLYPNSEFNLICNNREITLYLDKEMVNYELSPFIKLNGFDKTEITSVDDFSKSLFYDFISDDFSIKDLDQLMYESSKLSINYFKTFIEEAIEIIKNNFYEDFLLFKKGIRKIILFTHPNLKNFVTRKAHGAIYINVKKHSSVAYFVEEIIHQGSHIIFNSVTFEPFDFFQKNPYQNISDYIDNEYDTRSLYSAFHGVYTTYKVIYSFSKLVKSQFNIESNPLFKYQILGRLAMNLRRVNSGLELIHKEVFTKKGANLFCLINDKSNNIINENPIYSEINISKHPSVFEFNRFLNDNPIQSLNSKFFH